MTGTNLGAISQAWPLPCSQHAASQMKGMLESQVYEEEREEVRGLRMPLPLMCSVLTSTRWAPRRNWAGPQDLACEVAI